MPGEEKAMQQPRQRKKGKKSRPKGKGQNSRPGASIEGQGDLLGPPLFQPAPKKAFEEKCQEPVVKVGQEEKEESSVVICLQVLLPYLLAGMGMVMAGLVLDYVQVSASVNQKVLKNGFLFLLTIENVFIHVVFFLYGNRFLVQAVTVYCCCY